VLQEQKKFIRQLRGTIERKKYKYKQEKCEREIARGREGRVGQKNEK
jgi:hypothetical protein